MITARRVGAGLVLALTVVLLTTFAGGMAAIAAARCPTPVAASYDYDAESKLPGATPVASGSMTASSVSTTSADEDATDARARSTAATGIAAEAGESGLSSAARTCSVNSFTAATLVTMADGSKKPIKDVKVGDQVLATDPETGETAARPVTKLIRHGGKHTMVDVRLADRSVICATDHHPFWDATTGEFTYAIDLRPGHQVRKPDGTLLAVAATHVYDQDLTAYNLTVDGIHTYYAGATPVLVHNSCGGSLFRFGTERESAASLGEQAAAAERAGLPHGVSVRSRTNRPDAMGASREAVEAEFPVIKTGRDPYHYTVELPNPVTQDVADLFNTIFGRL